MTVWRPAPGIRFKALGLHWRGNRLLAAEVRDSADRLSGVRPLGGTVEFGESAAAAVVREFREELGVEVTTRGTPFFLENIFTHEGQTGHEVLAIFEVNLPESAFAGETRIAFRIDDDSLSFAQWFDPAELDQPGGPKLFPSGLRAHLAAV